jgi:hypothetical protein
MRVEKEVIHRKLDYTPLVGIGNVKVEKARKEKGPKFRLIR